MNNSEIKWTVEQENILIDWADKGMCYRWLHSKSHAKYNFLNACFTIPVIIMSTIAGTANFAQERFNEDIKNLVVMVIGSINILAGIITTIQQFLKIGELNEGHRVSSISWGKFSRNVKLELSKHPDQRSDPISFIKICKEEFDRLMETSPDISEEIITKFKKRFNDQKLANDSLCCKPNDNILNQIENKSDKQIELPVSSYNQLSKPEICDQIESIASKVYGRSIDKNITNTIVNNVNQDEVERMKSAKKTHILNIIRSFIVARSRIPTLDEVLNNINEKLVDVNTAKEYFKEFDLNSIYSETIDDDNNNPV